MTAHVVGVHGIGNRQAGRTTADAAAILGGRWTPALRRGLGTGSQVEAVVAYYAHHLAGETAQGVGDPAQLAEPEEQLLLDWAAALGAPTEVAQGRLTQPARTAADWIARRFGLDHALVRLLVTTFCREVHTYLTDPDRRAAVLSSTGPCSRDEISASFNLVLDLPDGWFQGKPRPLSMVPSSMFAQLAHPPLACHQLGRQSRHLVA